MQPDVTGGGVTASPFDLARLSSRSGPYDDTGTASVATARYPEQPNLEPMLCGSRFVGYERNRLVHGGDDQIEIAVLIDVADGAAASGMRTRHPISGSASNIFKPLPCQ